jgi:MFS transporter, AAHS family, vanillate permease
MATTAEAPVDPRALLAAQPMRWRQILAIAICVALNALDGFDVLSISFSSPGIANEWGIDRAALGVVLSMELIGMAAGSLTLGPVADRIGRKPTTLLCLAVMASGMFGTTQVGTIGALAATRLFTGLGIGGMLTTINAMTAEFANEKSRGAAVAIMAAGYPMGAIVGGSIATMLLATGTWRDVFMFGAAATVVLIPIVWLLVPETVGYLMHKREGDTLGKVNHSLRKLGHAEIGGLADEVEDMPKAAWTELFAPGLRRTTVLLTLAYFFHIVTFYFILKWVPKIVVDMGFSPSLAGSVLVWTNVGGLLGSLLLSFIALKIGLRALVVAALAGSVVMVTVFGLGQADLSGLSWAAGSAGFFTNSAVVGFYALMAASFPTALRASGTGFVIGVGRGGAVLGPIIAGFLFEGGFGLAAVAALMASGSLFAALAILAMPKAKAARAG